MSEKKIKELEGENNEIIKNLKYMHPPVKPKALGIIGKNIAEIKKLKGE